ncbi:MAG: insulinase family protein [Christensenellaceae bacterium]|nr:insulinase family protein [Christensenellaceae bacterium]
MGKLVKFECGLRLVLNKKKNTRSVAVGIYIGTGSAFEDVTQNGISHFLEHMFFKGTTTRSALDIAEEMESMGAFVNAFTSREATAYYTLSLSEHLERCVDILADMFFNSTFTDENLEKEKKVVLEEINMCEDDPTSVNHELLFTAYFGDKALGLPVLGPKECVTAFTAEDLRSYINTRYTPSNVVVSITGNFDENDTIALIEKYFESKLKERENKKNKQFACNTYSRYLKRIKPIEQANVALVFPGFKQNDKDLKSAAIFNNAFGGGMSSRLFQKIREELGYVYDVHSSNYAYSKTGIFVIFFATSPENVVNAIVAIKELIKEAIEKGISQLELSKGKEQIKTGLVLGAENTQSLMRASAESVLSEGRNFNLKRSCDEINTQTLEKVNTLITKIFDFNSVSVAYVGPETDVDLLDLLKRA